MLEMQGYTEVELVGKYVYDSLDEKGKNILKGELERRRQGIKGEYDTEFIHKNGTHIQARVGATPLYDDKGNYAGVMAVIVDISALKQAEERILHLNSVLNALRGISQLITLEEDREKLLQNSCNLLVNTRGYDTAWVAVTDEKGKFVTGVSCGIGPKIFKPILKNFKQGEYLPCTKDLLQQQEDTILCPQLGSQHADCPLGALGDNLGNLSGRLEYEGRVYGVLSVQLPSKLAVDKEEQELFKELTNDIAFALDRLEKETQLEEAEAKALEAEKLREVDRLRSELLANVSHELRTPLASIKGYASTLLRTDVKWSATQRQDFLQTIDNETDRLTKLINDILDMSRIEGGALKLRQERNRMPEIVGSIMSSLKVLTEHHQLNINFPRKLPAVFVDEMRIGQVISNLVDNAIKFSPAGSEISISAQRDKDKVVVSVTDHGVGMSKEVISKLFNRFYQAENVVTGRRHGTGLGLAICRGIIESHGGKIWVESKVGAGSTFSFSIPIWEENSDV
jgi:PAS domain S-box-containing protein